MEISEGMYVRFKDKRGSHYIRKITSVNTEYPGKLYAGIYIDKTANNCNGVSLKNIINASHRLIDLIDKGDYVNGYKVLWVYNTEIAKSGPSRQYRERDIRCFTLERQIEEMKEDIAFCLHSIEQETEMSTDERTRSEMETCSRILSRWCK